MITKGRVLKINKTEKADNGFAESNSTDNSSSGKDHFKSAKLKIHQEITDRLKIDSIPIEELNTPEWKIKIEQAIKSSIASLDSDNFDANLGDNLFQEVMDEIFGLGPIENFIKNDRINEVMINGKDNIYIERDGCVHKTEKTFSSNDMILSMRDRILAPLGKRIDTSSPTVDARLKDGSRVHAIIEPLSLLGPVVTIRKFLKNMLKVSDLIESNSLNEELAAFLKLSVQKRKNIIISGGTGTGKTTLLNVISAFINPRERIITIEDSSELKLPQTHTIYLESRPPNIEGKGEISIRDLLKNSLRMRPDRIIIGECRGGEALDMLQAMNTGHSGSMTTLHANSCRDTLSRLETMVLMSGFDLPLRAIREQISSAVDLIIQLTRTSNGKRIISSVTEVCGTENSVITTQELFRLSRNGKTKIISIEATGNIPKIFDSQ